jgi:hypothetical protein
MPTTACPHTGGHAAKVSRSGAVVAVMKLSTDWHDFRAKLDKLYPRIGKPTQLSLEFADDAAGDFGEGL